MDKVDIVENNNIYIENSLHQTIAKLSNKGKLKWQGQTRSILQVRVLGMIQRRKTDGDGKRETVESWELPIVEILHRR